jgi:hypothetical protein
MITRSIGVRTHGANQTASQVAPEWNDRWMSKGSHCFFFLILLYFNIIQLK